jgi:glycerol-1-phosphate dehydrogenase [NAD(P)+]
VGLATILTTEAFRILLEEFDPAELNVARCYPPVERMQARLRAAIDPLDPTGKVAAECWHEYRQKLEAWHARRPEFEAALQDWPSVQAGIRSIVRPPEKVVELLKAVESPLRFEELDPPLDEARVKFAFVNSPFARRRPMLSDLLLFLNWDFESLWSRAWARSRQLTGRGQSEDE